MGKYVIEFDQDMSSSLEASVNQQQFSFVTNEGKSPRDGRLQKVLCYSSYYLMTFSAFCAFAPDKVAYAAEFITNTIVM